MVARRWPGRLTSTTCCSSSRGSTPLTLRSSRPTCSGTSVTCMRPAACCPSGCAAHGTPRARNLPAPREPPATSHLSALLQVTTAVHTYDACACRLRWAQLDHEACGLVREAVRRQAAGLAPFENPSPPAAQAAAASAVSVSAPVRNGRAAEADDEESEEEDLSGVVDVNALRRRLMADAGYTVSPAEEPQPPAASPAPTMRPPPAARPGPAAGPGPAAVRGGAPPAVQQAQAPSRGTGAPARQPAAAPAAAATRGGATATPELAALSELAVQLS